MTDDSGWAPGTSATSRVSREHPRSQNRDLGHPATRIDRDGGYALFEFVVPESAVSGFGGEADGGAEHVCETWRRRAGLFGDCLAGGLGRGSCISASVWARRAGR